mgnify:CR=1 FL=1
MAKFKKRTSMDIENKVVERLRSISRVEGIAMTQVLAELVEVRYMQLWELGRINKENEAALREPDADLYLMLTKDKKKPNG